MGRALTLSVSQLNDYVAKSLQMDPLLQNLEVRGEIGSVKSHQSGMVFFTLKDDSAQISAVAFADAALRYRSLLSFGKQVIIRGRVGLYARGGQYRLMAEEIRAAGLGALYERFLALKEKLSRAGLFDSARKKPLPQTLQTLGVITSPTGAVIHDIITVASRRDPAIHILLCPVAVQGESAAGDILRAIDVMNRTEGISVIILARGGGSMEDLWVFNDERVVRAVAASRVPIISAIGHETDFTLVDFAADCRAATPSAAAEIAVPRKLDRRAQLADMKRRLKLGITGVLERRRRTLATQMNLLGRYRPDVQLQRKKAAAEIIRRRLVQTMLNQMNARRQQVGRLVQALELLNPSAQLRRGYAIVDGEDGVVDRAARLSPGQKVRIAFWDGSAQAVVEQTELAGEMTDGKRTEHNL